MRPIDADKLMEIIKQHDYPLSTIFGSIDNGMFTLGIQQAIDECQTLELEPVIHGEWELHFCEPTFARMDCSVCHAETITEYINGNEIDYPPRCPNCGAHMEESKE